jgi:hypothetical protein
MIRAEGFNAQTQVATTSPRHAARARHDQQTDQRECDQHLGGRDTGERRPAPAAAQRPRGNHEERGDVQVHPVVCGAS